MLESRSRWGPRALLLVAALAAVTLFVGLIPGVRPAPGTVPWLDDVVQPLGYVAAAAAATWIAVVHTHDRLLWALIAASTALRAYGFVHTIFVLDRAPVYPSLADASWILSSLLLLAALQQAVRRVTPQASTILALDAVIAGLTVTAVAATLLDDTIDRLLGDGLPADVLLTNLGYPFLDVATFGLLAGLLVLERWRLPADEWVLLGGVLLFALVDTWFLYLVTTGGLEPGNVLAPLSLTGTVAIAAAGCVSPRRERDQRRRPQSLTPPVLLAGLCVLVLAYDALGAVGTAANVLAAAGVFTAIGRAFVTLTGDRRASEATIAEKDEELVRFRALVEASSDYIALGTLQGQILYLNPAGRHMVGLPPEGPIPALTIAQALTEEAARHREEVEKPIIMATGSWRGESALRSRDGGAPIPTFKNTFVVKDASGEPWLLGTIQRDITQLKEAEAYIERFRSLVEASSDFIALAELDGTVRYLNPAGRQLVGLDPDADVATTTIADYLTEEGLVASLEVEQPAVVAEGRWRGESTLRDLRGGPPTPVTINSFLVRKPETGEPWLLATVQRDISELHVARRRLERLADERQELLRHLVTAQESERTRIAADVHDDSVQSMAAVDLRLGLLQRRVEMGSSPEECLSTLRELRDTVGHANERLRYLLFDLDSPAQRDGLVPALREAAAFVLGPAVRWEVRGEDAGLSETSRVLAYRIAKEAMVNVRKHAGATSVWVDVDSSEAGVSVVVADDGAGLPEQGVVERPGHRGVADMRDRAAVAGGTVEFRNREGGGAEMRLWIPTSADAH